MRRKVKILVSFLLIFAQFVFAQYGKIAGKVVDKETKEPLPGASVIIQGTTLGAATDASGNYVILNVPAGTYTVVASYVGYQTVTVSGVQVVAGLTRELNFELPSTAIELRAVEVVAERPLIEKSATNAIRVVTAADIEKLPVRDVNTYFALQAGVSLQYGRLYIRGSRSDEVGYMIEGASVTNILGARTGARGGAFASRDRYRSLGGGLITTIPEALEEISVQAGGYNAEFGNANAGIVQQVFKTGTSKFSSMVQFETDNFGNYPGKKFLGTYSYGYSNLVLTLGGPLLTEKVKFFLAGENNFVRDYIPHFFKGYNFGYLKDSGRRGGTRGDSALVAWDDANIPGRMVNRYTGNGTLTFDFKPLQIRVAGAYTWSRERANNSLRNIFNLARLPVTDQTEVFTSVKASYFISAKTFVEATFSFLDYRNKSYEPAFKDNVLAYDDSLQVVRAYGSQYRYVSRYVGPPPYDFHGFLFYRPGTLFAGYSKFQQGYYGGNIALTSQVKNHEIKVGGSYQRWTVRHYGIGTGGLFRAFHTLPDSARDENYLYKLLGTYVNNYGFDRFGRKVDSGEDGPRHPYFFSAYVQDRIEFSDLIINAGLRYDYMYLDAWRLKDPNAPRADLNTRKLLDLEKGKPRAYLQPRLGFSFPVTDRTVFHLQYGIFVQPPALTSLYAGLSYYPGSVYLPSIELIPDPLAFDPDPVKTTQYEIGFSQQFTDFAAFDITGFYKDVRGQLQVSTVPITGGPYAGTKYAIYSNGDFENVYGLEFTLRIRRVGRVQAQVNYTLQDARGTNSFANGAWAAVGITQITPTLTVPLTYNQTHRGTINIDYRFGKGDGGPLLERLGINLLITFNSGHPYTLATGGIAQQDADDGGILNDGDPRNRAPLEPINASKTPWVWNVDLRVDKTITVGPVNLNLYVYVQNLFNTKNVINVYYRTGNAYDDGFLTNPSLSGTFVNQLGPMYVQLYRAINLENRQHQWRFNGILQDLFGPPRQLRAGIRVEL